MSTMRRKDFTDLKTSARVTIMVLPDEHTTEQTVTILVNGRIVARIKTDAVDMCRNLFKE